MEYCDYIIITEQTTGNKSELATRDSAGGGEGGKLLQVIEETMYVYRDNV